MDLERLKMWRDALLEAEEKGRDFSLMLYARHNAESPCGFTACLAGDLALYEPAKELGFSLSFSSPGGPGNISFGERDAHYAMRAFLIADTAAEKSWVDRTIFPDYALTVYGKWGRDVTRADGLARIEAKIKELETA